VPLPVSAAQAVSAGQASCSQLQKLPVTSTKEAVLKAFSLFVHLLPNKKFLQLLKILISSQLLTYILNFVKE
jgi:hypothetical protein